MKNTRITSWASVLMLLSLLGTSCRSTRNSITTQNEKTAHFIDSVKQVRNIDMIRLDELKTDTVIYSEIIEVFEDTLSVQKVFKTVLRLQKTSVSSTKIDTTSVSEQKSTVTLESGDIVQTKTEKTAGGLSRALLWMSIIIFLLTIILKRKL